MKPGGYLPGYVGSGTGWTMVQVQVTGSFSIILGWNPAFRRLAAEKPPKGGTPTHQPRVIEKLR